MKVLTANLIWFLYSAVRTRHWKRASRDVEEAQKEILLRLLSSSAGTAFGRRHSFGGIDSVAAFQETVPIQSYEDIRPDIEAIAAGAPDVLTADEVHRFGVSSGSTSASKLVPYTASLVAEFQEGIDPWIYHFMREHPRMLGGRAYWSVTPVGDREKRSSGGIPIGFDDERSYFGKLTQWVLGTVMAAPSELALVQDMDAFRYATLRFLLQEKSLSWLSVWNPSFVTLLLSPLEKWLERLIGDVRSGSLSVDLGVSPEVAARIRKTLKASPRRARELEQIRDRRSGNLYESIWPHLRLVSCWAHGNAAEAVNPLRDYFPNAIIQPKGLIATEAFVSFPLRGEASALSINSHFFEFEEIEGQVIKLAHQLDVGKQYAVIVTTGGGLYRYRLHDVIEALGFENQCPLIRFIGRQDKVVDVRGEKLNEGFVSDVARRKLSRSGHHATFWMVAPEVSSVNDFAYTLFIQLQGNVVNDSMIAALGPELDAAFRENFHYDYCRRLGQLEEVRVFLIGPGQDASHVYLTTCAASGQRLGDIKPVALHPFQHWSERFQGRFVS